jgi:prolyl-tRNA editing enzyme YbaK/EbsC (Cys-tRNA(Pro) deacylase)
VTGMSIGGVSPIGLPDGLPIWIDSRVVRRRRIILGGGSRSCKVIGSPELLTVLPNVEIVDGLAVDPPPAPE